MNYQKFRDFRIPVGRHAYTARDAIIYALSVGAAEHLDNPHAISYLSDTRGPCVLPSFAVDLGHPGFWMADPATTVDPSGVLHAEEKFTLFAPLPASADVIGETRVVDVVDKGAAKGALVYLQKTVTDAATGTKLAQVDRTVMLRKDGGYGGPSGTPRPAPITPEGNPDFVCDVHVRPEQAFLYRLNGDDNPLHVEPEAARAAGFERPIAHGLCTFGLAATATLFQLADGDASRMRSFYARFSAPAYPGETLQIRIWRNGAVQAVAKERNVVVLSHGHAEILPEDRPNKEQ